MFIPPLRIALSGGGMKGIAHIGALEVLHERGYLKPVKEYLGISAGAFCAFCLCIGCSLSELRLVITMLDFGLMRHIEPETIFQFPETFGLDDGANLDKLLSVILKTKGLSPELTFSELEAYAEKKSLPALRVFATNLNTCLAQEFSAKATPAVAVKMALRASMCIPFYFTPVQDLSGQTFVDGGLISHLPIYMISEEECESTLCLAFSQDHKPRPGPIQDFLGFLSQVYYSFDHHQIRFLSKKWKDRFVFLPCGNFASVHFEAAADEKIELIESGRRGMEAFLAGAGSKGNPPPRRFSVA